MLYTNFPELYIQIYDTKGTQSSKIIANTFTYDAIIPTPIDIINIGLQHIIVFKLK